MQVSNCGDTSHGRTLDRRTLAGHRAIPAAPPALSARRAKAYIRSPMPDRHPFRPPQWRPVGVAPPGDGLRLRRYLLAALPRVDTRGRLGQGPPPTAPSAGAARADQP